MAGAFKCSNDSCGSVKGSGPAWEAGLCRTCYTKNQLNMAIHQLEEPAGPSAVLSARNILIVLRDWLGDM